MVTFGSPWTPFYLKNIIAKSNLLANRSWICHKKSNEKPDQMVFKILGVGPFIYLKQHEIQPILHSKIIKICWKINGNRKPFWHLWASCSLCWLPIDKKYINVLVDHPMNIAINSKICSNWSSGLGEYVKSLQTMTEAKWWQFWLG